MDVKIAIQILELSDEYTKDDIRKAYYKKCLQYHPDKNKNGAKMFKLCVEAKETLYNELGQNHSAFVEPTKSYSELFMDFMKTTLDKNNISHDQLTSVFHTIIHNCTKASLKVFETLDYKTLQYVYCIIIKYKNTLHVDDTTITELKQMLETKHSGKQTIYLLEPTLEDLLQHNIYKLMIDNKEHYIPLWHNELYFTNDIVVHVNPSLDNTIQIDNNNNVIVIKSFPIKEVLYKKVIPIELGTKILEIPVHKLLIKPLQEYRFRKCGIPRIDTDDMFNNTDISDIIVYVILE